jgi:hypothetical protein
MQDGAPLIAANPFWLAPTIAAALELAMWEEFAHATRTTLELIALLSDARSIVTTMESVTLFWGNAYATQVGRAFHAKFP